MMTALQTLIDNGCSEDAMEVLLNDILGASSFEDDSDKRCCIAMLFDREQGDKDDPSNYSNSYGNVVDGPHGEYLILDNDEADAVCREYIEDSLWSFIPSFLSGETGIDETVFEALAVKGESSNDAVRSIINGTCGIDHIVESVIFDDGRGPYLNHYDGEENEVSIGSDIYYIYRWN